RCVVAFELQSGDKVEIVAEFARVSAEVAITEVQGKLRIQGDCHAAADLVGENRVRVPQVQQTAGRNPPSGVGTESIAHIKGGETDAAAEVGGYDRVGVQVGEAVEHYG